MNKNINISLLGGDLRQVAVANKLASIYGKIKVFGTDFNFFGDDGNIEFENSLDGAISNSQVIVLPLPASLDEFTLNCPFYRDADSPKLADIASKISGYTMVIGGKIPEKFTALLENKGIKVFDFFKSEYFQVSNAYTTAEAALSIAMNMLDKNIKGANIAVTGYGRIGKHLCNLLQSVGADVTLAARKDSVLAYADSCSMKTVRIKDGIRWNSAFLKGYDVIYNTVPTWLFDREFLLKVDKNTLIIDLASAPGGVDICAAKELSSNVSWATSLPGKYAPQSAGNIIAECLQKIIAEEFL